MKGMNKYNKDGIDIWKSEWVQDGEGESWENTIQKDVVMRKMTRSVLNLSNREDFGDVG